VLHRDIHPANVFYKQRGKDGSYDTKLGDFGIALNIEKDNAEYMKETHGNLIFLSPDIQNTYQSDIYSFGLCLWSILTGLDLDSYKHWTEQWFSYDDLNDKKKNRSNS